MLRCPTCGELVQTELAELVQAHATLDPEGRPVVGGSEAVQVVAWRCRNPDCPRSQPTREVPGE